jgi:hypothetical protein
MDDHQCAAADARGDALEAVVVETGLGDPGSPEQPGAPMSAPGSPVVKPFQVFEGLICGMASSLLAHPASLRIGIEISLAAEVNSPM